MAKKKPAGRVKSFPLVKRLPKGSSQSEFTTVLQLIEAARGKALAAVNTTLIELYWSIGEYINKKVEANGWGMGTVEELAEYIRKYQPSARGYSARNLWRMNQFYEAYRHQPKLSTLLTELSWSHNLAILSRSKSAEEREFYLRTCLRERWTFRDLQQQISRCLFEYTVLTPPKLSTVLTELHPGSESIFKDKYMVDFLALPQDYSEADLQTGLVAHLKDFLIELGRDFCYIGSQYPVQVGKRDFAIDLLFFNRALNYLIAFELKVDEFQPEHLGKLEFYLEALDRKVKKPHEKQSIGVLLCATKDIEVVEYALNRTMSPTLIAEYQAHLPSKAILQRKLHEFYLLAEEQAESTKAEKRLRALSKKKKNGRKQ